MGFALSKLVSESNSLEKDPQTGLLPPPSQSSHSFFINYNLVNGIQSSFQEEKKFYWEKLNQSLEKIADVYLIFLLVVGPIFLVLAIIKNCLLKFVLNKKTEILEVFFEIPRKSCASIQKECEKFIIKLSLEGDEEDMEISDLEDNEEGENKNNKAQKKRQIMGE